MRPWEKLHARWRGDGYNGGLDANTRLAVYGSHAPYSDHGWSLGGEGAVAAIEARYGLVLPLDFRDHLKAMPMNEEGIRDDEWVCFWSPERIETLREGIDPRAQPPGSYLWFCDYMLDCWLWAICCEPGPDYGKIALCNTATDPWFVFASFSDCVEAYLADPHAFATDFRALA